MKTFLIVLLSCQLFAAFPSHFRSYTDSVYPWFDNSLQQRISDHLELNFDGDTLNDVELFFIDYPITCVFYDFDSDSTIEYIGTDTAYNYVTTRDNILELMNDTYGAHSSEFSPSETCRVRFFANQAHKFNGEPGIIVHHRPGWSQTDWIDSLYHRIQFTYDSLLEATGQKMMQTDTQFEIGTGVAGENRIGHYFNIIPEPYATPGFSGMGGGFGSILETIVNYNFSTQKDRLRYLVCHEFGHSFWPHTFPDPVYVNSCDTEKNEMMHSYYLGWYTDHLFFDGDDVVLSPDPVDYGCGAFHPDSLNAWPMFTNIMKYHPYYYDPSTMQEYYIGHDIGFYQMFEMAEGHSYRVTNHFDNYAAYYDTIRVACTINAGDTEYSFPNTKTTDLGRLALVLDYKIYQDAGCETLIGTIPVSPFGVDTIAGTLAGQEHDSLHVVVGNTADVYAWMLVNDLEWWEYLDEPAPDFDTDYNGWRQWGQHFADPAKRGYGPQWIITP